MKHASYHIPKAGLGSARAAISGALLRKHVPTVLARCARTASARQSSGSIRARVPAPQLYTSAARFEAGRARQS
eukprot:3962584-Alexandrium_andersonii.AAC.1